MAAIDTMEQDLLNSYRDLHDGLSDMIEEGRLTVADIPDDYQWLVDLLISLARESHVLATAIAYEGGDEMPAAPERGTKR